MDFMNITNISNHLKLLGYKKYNSKYGVTVFTKKNDFLFSQAILVASPTPKSITFDFEIGILNLHLEDIVLEIEQAQHIGVYSLHYGWKAGEISGKDSSPDEINIFYDHLKNLDSKISSEIEEANKVSLNSLTSFCENVFFADNPIRKYGSYAAFRGVISSIIERGYLDPSIENTALSSLSSDPIEYKQLEFKLSLIKKHLALKAETT